MLNINTVIPGYSNLSEEEQAEVLQETFREVFESDKGKVVLNVILEDLHFLEPCRTEEDKALNNYSKFFIMERLGIKDSLSITDAVFSCKDK